MMTKLGKLFVFGPVSGKGSFLVRSRFVCNIKGYVDKGKNILVNGKKKLCREQCETDSILQLDHTIQCFSSFIPHSFVSFVMIVCHFLGVLVSVLRLARLYDCV